MSDFFLTLPSNTNPENRTNSYSIRLPKKIKLDGQWEVALAEIQYPYSWNNITGRLQPDDSTDNWVEIIFKNGYQANFFIPPGYYSTAEKLIKGIAFGQNKLSKQLKRKVAQWQKRKSAEKYFKLKSSLQPGQHKDVFQFAFKYDETLKRIQFKCSPDHIQSVKIASKLQYMLGFDRNYFDRVTKIWAKYIPDLRNGFYSLYVYCNVVEPQLVGNTVATLLRTVHITG